MKRIYFVIIVLMITLLYYSCGLKEGDKYQVTYTSYLSPDFSPDGDTIALIEFIYTYERRDTLNKYDDIVDYAALDHTYIFNLLIYDLDWGDTDKSIRIPLYKKNLGDAEGGFTQAIGYIYSDIDWYQSDTVLVYLGFAGHHNEMHIINIKSKIIVDTIDYNSDSYIPFKVRVSPDGKRIAYSDGTRTNAKYDRKGGVIVVNMDGTNENQICTSGNTGLWNNDKEIIYFGDEDNLIKLTINNDNGIDTLIVLWKDVPIRYGLNDISDIHSLGDTILFSGFYLDYASDIVIPNLKVGNPRYSKDNSKIIGEIGAILDGSVQLETSPEKFDYIFNRETTRKDLN